MSLYTKFSVSVTDASYMTRVFISYSYQDEPYRLELERHLSGLRRNGYIDTWTDLKILPGEEWDRSVSETLNQARIILLLISADFLASEYCNDAELKTALQRHEQGAGSVIPIILRPCDWQNSPFADLQPLPVGGQPIEAWEQTDEAYQNIVNGIKASIRRLNGEEEGTVFEGAENPAEELLSSLRRRALAATDARDFRILHFDVKQFKLEHPQNVEIDEIERMVKNGLAYETSNTLAYPRTTTKSERPSGSGRRNRIIGFAIVALALVAFLAWWYFLKKSQ